MYLAIFIIARLNVNVIYRNALRIKTLICYFTLLTIAEILPGIFTLLGTCPANLSPAPTIRKRLLWWFYGI
jgi:hypothetical protein